MTNLTKRDIARAIHEAEPSISISEAVCLVDSIFEAIKDRLARSDKVMITNFGTFQVVGRAPRQGINPATGGSLVIAGHRAVSFRAAPALQGSINGSGGDTPDAPDDDILTATRAGGTL